MVGTKSDDKDAKSALLEAGRKVFAEKGFEGATVKDLADAAGVNVSLVSYYFGGKEGLFKACLQNFADARFDAIVRILQPPQTAEEMRVRLKMFGDEMALVHVNEPNVCKIIHSGIELQQRFATEAFTGAFLRIFECFVKFLRDAEKAKLIRKLKDFEPAAHLIFGSLMHFLRTEPIRRFLGKPSIQDAKYREEILHLWVDLTLRALELQPAGSTDTGSKKDSR